MEFADVHPVHCLTIPTTTTIRPRTSGALPTRHEKRHNIPRPVRLVKARASVRVITPRWMRRPALRADTVCSTRTTLSATHLRMSRTRRYRRSRGCSVSGNSGSQAQELMDFRDRDLEAARQRCEKGEIAACVSQAEQCRACRYRCNSHREFGKENVWLRYLNVYQE